jgi:predicted dehydrogenase
MGRSLTEAREMVAYCEARGVPFLIHENFRWQAPFRALKAALDSGAIGAPFRATLSLVTGFPVFANQPALAELEEYILTDLGSHTLDQARCLFGEADLLFCLAHTVHEGIAGEDAATVMMRMGAGVTVVCQMGEAETPLEDDPLFETLAFVEGTRGSARLGRGQELRITTEAGTQVTRHPPKRYDWVHPDYALAQASMVPLLHDLAAHLGDAGPAETTAADNLRTMELVFAAYRSFREGVLCHV